ncbi:MAG: diacylglycerol kinase family protein [Bacillota bacterium]
MVKKLSFRRNIKYAYAGIKYCILNEPHMRIHLLASLLSILLGYILEISLIEWILILLAICLVLVLEIVNTAVESIVDMYTKEFHPLAKTAKDLAAGAVLTAALCALIVGAVIFLPKIIVIILYL